MDAIIHKHHQKPILAWFENRLFLTDPQQQRVLCEFEIRSHHNGKALSSPEIALPEVNETVGTGDTGFKFPDLNLQHMNRRDST